MPKIRECLIEETTRHGKTRYLFQRESGGRRITIRGTPNDPDFEKTYEYLLAGGDLQKEYQESLFRRIREKEQPYTVQELGFHYFDYIDTLLRKQKMSPYTAQHYSRFINRFVKEYGQAPIESVEPHHIHQVLDGWSDTDNAFNNALRAIKHLFRYGEQRWGLSANPSRLIRKEDIVTDGFTPWEREEVEAFFRTHERGSMAHMAMTLLIHAAPRRADLAILGPSHIETIRGEEVLKFRPQKTRKKSGVSVIVPMTASLRDAIDASYDGGDTYIRSSRGTPFTPESLGTKMSEWVQEAGLRPNLSCHGMRKTVGIDMAENGASLYEIMAALGHTSPKASLVYTKEADRRKLSQSAAAKSTLSQFITR
ncbi:tyrosine-type recombinase/integrase [Shimia sp. MIT1388]|uniref:tyrosine-type recombinase/integrase n=1 Tax=Shimia sp. MIT1388 TaxID=3096992 RepID=UPI00399BF06B